MQYHREMTPDDDRRQFKHSAHNYMSTPNRLKRMQTVGRQPGESRMMAATGKMVQYANEEFRRWKNHGASNPTETNASAFARARHNRMEAYAGTRTY